MSKDIGERLRFIRDVRGWSQRQLARRAGVTNSAISQMEQGRISPSVASLKKVLDGIPISLADFFSLDLKAQARCFYPHNSMPNSGVQGVISKLVGFDKPNRGLSMEWQSLPPGSDTGSSLITADEDRAGVVFSGAIELTVGVDSSLMGPGDGFYLCALRPYRIRNLSEEPCIIALSYYLQSRAVDTSVTGE
ncbi:helix-turn-helix domain-containing protein [Marinibactrum halimedae]|nr:helix-turn-helix domain-containing protein [Marinibactrum halimedae]MCD9459861.1 helix-turn-helix domain-containing protein [Marinibactrum halimedae]